MTSQSEVALELLDVVRTDPRRALRRAEELLASDLTDHVRSIVARAAGLAARSAATLDDSIGFFEASVAAGHAAGDHELVAEAQLSLAGSRAIAGDLDGALTSLDDRPPGLPANLQRRFEFQQATILARTGFGARALDIYDRLLPGFRADDDGYFTALTLMNCGRIRLELADVDRARRDLEEAHDLYVRAGSDVAAAYVLHNLGELSIVTGDLCEALDRLQQSRDELARLTNTPWEPDVTRGEALLEAGLFEEAERLAERLIELMGDSGLRLDRAEARLLLARARLGMGDSAGSHRAAMSAADEFAQQGRSRWRTQAHLAALRAEPIGGDPDTIEHRVDALVAELMSAGLVVQSAEALAEGVVRLSLAAPERGAALLSRLHRLPNPTRIELRMFVAYADAFHRTAIGNRRGAFRSIESAVRLAQRHRLSLGATELRVSGARHTGHLAQLGLRLALDGTDHRLVFRYSELDRAASLRSRPVRRPRRDEDRRAVAEIRSLARAVDNADPADAPAAERRLRRATRRFQELERLRRPGEEREIPAVPRLADVRRHVGDRLLLSMFVVGDRLRAQAIRADRTRLVDLGGLDEWANTFERLRARAAVQARRADQNDAGGAGGIDEVDARLAACLRDDAEIILAPPPRLVDAPWCLLPSCRAVPTSIVPSAHMALRPARVVAVQPHVTVAAGPGLDHADLEATSVADVWASDVLVGDDATTSRVLDGLGNSDIVHVACHGRHRRGNPLMSELSLADGPLLVADIEEQPEVAPIIVLSACHSSASDVYGNETMGTVTALLGAGAACVIAGIGLVPDDDSTAALMTALHHRLREGAPVAHALHQTYADQAGPATALYQCYGSSASVRPV